MTYEYQKAIANSNQSFSLHPDDNQFPFPKKWFKNIGYTIDGFSFTLKDAPDNLKDVLNPSDELINDGENNNIEVVDKTFTMELILTKKSF